MDGPGVLQSIGLQRVGARLKQPSMLTKLYLSTKLVLRKSTYQPKDIQLPAQSRSLLIKHVARKHRCKGKMSPLLCGCKFSHMVIYSKVLMHATNCSGISKEDDEGLDSPRKVDSSTSTFIGKM